MRKRQIKVILLFIICKFEFPFKLLSKVVLFIEDIFIKNEYEQNKKVNGEKTIKRITKNKDNLYVFCANGNGDTVIIASLLKDYIKRFNCKRTYLVLLNHQSFIAKLYEYIDGTVVISKDEMNDIVYYFQRSNLFEGKNYFYAFFNQNINKKGHIDYFCPNCDRKNLLSDKYKMRLFDFPKTKLPYYANKMYNDKVLKNVLKNYILTDRTIILMPVTHSEINMSPKFWKKLAKILISKGYEVYTNVGKNEIPIECTKSLDITLEELYYIIPRVKCFVAIRSGICEFLALNSPNLIVINSSKRNYNKWDDVNLFDPKKNIINLYSSIKTDKKIYNEVIFSIENYKDVVKK